MDYEKITQKSRIYKYGDGEEFLSKEEAKQLIEKEFQKVKTELALMKMHDKAIVKINEAFNGFQIVVELRIPKLF